MGREHRKSIWDYSAFIPMQDVFNMKRYDKQDLELFVNTNHGNPKKVVGELSSDIKKIDSSIKIKYKENSMSYSGIAVSVSQTILVAGAILFITIVKQYDAYCIDTLCTTHITFNNRKGPFKNIKNRKAMNAFISSIRNEIIETIYGGNASPIYGFYPPIVNKSLGIIDSCEEKNNVDMNIFKNYTELVIGYKKGEVIHKKIADYIAMQLGKFTQVKIKEYKNIKEALSLDADLYIHNIYHQIVPLSSSVIDGIRQNFSELDYNYLLDLYDQLKNEDVDKHDVESFIYEFKKVIPMIPLLSKKDIKIIKRGFTGLKPDGRGVLWNIHEIY